MTAKEKVKEIIRLLDTNDEILIEIDVILFYTINVLNFPTTLETLNHTDSWKQRKKYVASCIENIDNSNPIGDFNLTFF